MADETNSSPGFSPIDFLRTRSLANVVQAEIERMIVEGKFTPNERINENALAQHFSVSRGPIREACSALAALGLVQIIPNRGFFVRELNEQEAHEVSEARAGVFAFMAMLLAERVTDAQIEELRGLVASMEDLADKGEVHQYYPVNLEFHSAIARMCGSGRLAQIYLGLARELHIQRYRALSSGHVLHVSNAEHRALFEAVAARDPSRAFAAGRAHILNGMSRTDKASQSNRRSAED